MRFADLDAVTLDAYGTLLTLRDPVPALGDALRSRGEERDPDTVARAFRAEAEYYRAHCQSARDADTLAELRRACTGVFLRAVGSSLDPAAFADAFVGALVFEPVGGAFEAVDALAARGLALAVVANWEVSLREHLRRHRIDGRFASIVISAEVGASKPDPQPFRVALAELGVPPERAVHVGDDASDEAGARAAGMHFAWAPLADAVRTWR